MAERVEAVKVFSIQYSVFSVQQRSTCAVRLQRALFRLRLICIIQSRRDCVLQPRVARNELPWEGPCGREFNPERVAAGTLKDLTRWFCLPAMLLAAILCPFAATAHVGSPNVFFEGKAGVYAVRVAIRPPAVLPGSVQVDVRAEGGTVTNVILEARLFDVAGAGEQPTVKATQVAGETNFFNGVLWLLRNGSYSVDVTIEGDKGKGSVSVPLNSAAIRAPVMKPLWKGVLIGLGAMLFLGAVWIAGAVARDNGADARAMLLPRDKIRGFIVAAITAAALAGGGFAATARWRMMDQEFRNNALYKPLPVLASAQTNGSVAVLHLEKVGDDATTSQTWETLAADHGKLMHLFLLKEPDYSAFAHLHPVRRDGQNFENVLPPLPGGRYDVYAEITYDNGLNQTLVTNLELAGVKGTVAQMRFGSNDVVCQSAIVPPGNSDQPVALDADDSWHVGDSTPDAGRNSKAQFCRLMGWIEHGL